MEGPHLGILTGIRAEADLLIQHLPADLNTTIYLSGARPDRARAHAERLIAAGATHLLSFGYAGGLDPSLVPGTILLPRAIIAPDGRTYLADGDWLVQALTVLDRHFPFAATHVGVEEPILKPEHKATAYLRSRGAAGVDMESHILAAAAQAYGLPFLAVRVVLDSAEHELPKSATASVRADGGISLIRLFASLVARPHEILALNRLARAQQAAEKALLRCCSRGAASGFGMR